jgi:hypothetical protein
MAPKEYFHIVGYVFGLAAFASIYLSIRPALASKGRDVHLKALIPIQFFRYFGLTALLPGVFDLAPAGFSEAYLTQIMAGDVLAAILALGSFFLLQIRATSRIAAIWFFNVFGFLDYLNAGARVTPAIHDANILGPFGWLVITVFLPAWLVSHIAIFFALRQPKKPY